MHRTSGQFGSLKESDKETCENGGVRDGTSYSESDSHGCQHCGISEQLTPAMLRCPFGPRTLCNACGLMWANKDVVETDESFALQLLTSVENASLDLDNEEFQTSLDEIINASSSDFEFALGFDE